MRPPGMPWRRPAVLGGAPNGEWRRSRGLSRWGIPRRSFVEAWGNSPWKAVKRSWRGTHVAVLPGSSPGMRWRGLAGPRPPMPWGGILKPLGMSCGRLASGSRAVSVLRQSKECLEDSAKREPVAVKSLQFLEGHLRVEGVLVSGISVQDSWPRINALQRTGGPVNFCASCPGVHWGNDRSRSRKCGLSSGRSQSAV